jgi:sugar/nucleoside kinase (ribokinase family)
MGSIIVVGSINMDLVVLAPRAPESGETLAGTDFRTVCGGKGANQAFAAARLPRESRAAEREAGRSGHHPSPGPGQ